MWSVASELQQAIVVDVEANVEGVRLTQSRYTLNLKIYLEKVALRKFDVATRDRRSGHYR